MSDHPRMSKFHIWSRHSTNSRADVSFHPLLWISILSFRIPKQVSPKLCKYWVQNILMTPTVWMPSWKPDLSTVIRRDYSAPFLCKTAVSWQQRLLLCIGKSWNFACPGRPTEVISFIAFFQYVCKSTRCTNILVIRHFIFYFYF